MKQYLIDTFRFNDWANKQVLEKIRQLPESGEAIRLFSHLINSQYKWMARINGDAHEPRMSWFDPRYELESLESEWNKSLGVWLGFLERLPERELDQRIYYGASDGVRRSSLLREIALQLCYHSIHHRAQICWLIRRQEIEPPFIEYIGYTWKKDEDKI